MLASRLYGLEDIRLDAVDDPAPGEGEVRVKVAHNGICGSDLHMYFRESPWRSGSPITLGHEFCGVVDELGSGVSGIELGTPVAVRPFYKCGACARCARGLEHLCSPVKVLGCGADGRRPRRVLRHGRRHGVRPARRRDARTGRARRADGGVVQRRAAGRRRTGHARGRVRAGPIGVGVLLGLRAKGIDDVVVVEPSAVRRDTIAGLGADDVSIPRPTTSRRGDGAHQRRRRRRRVRVRGRGRELPAAVPLVDRRGKLVVVAVYEDELSWNPTQMMLNEIELRGSMGYETGVYEQVIDLMDQGHYPTSGWVEHIPWGGAGRRGLRARCAVASA